MSTRDFNLNGLTNDLEFTDLDLTLIDGIEYYKQKTKIRLQFFFGEWFLDTTMGLKFFDVVFVKNPDLFLVDNLVKVTISETEGFIQITEYSSTFNTIDRTFSITAKILTDAGEFTLNDALQIQKG